MIGTATTTNRDVNRIKPGDGKLNPVTHFVRIEVVPHDSDANDAHESHGSGQSHGESHGLTENQLRAAEAKLKKKDAPPSSGGTSMGQASSLPQKMFDVLEPWDIVAVGQEAASVRTVDSKGNPVLGNPTNEGGDTTSAPKGTRRLFAHDHHHTDTVLRVWTESDTIEYQCDEEFEIVRVERAGWKIYGAPDNPFAGRPPYKATPRATDGLWIWRSSVLPATADNQQYKMTFKVNGKLVDPDVLCGNPPPSP